MFQNQNQQGRDRGVFIGVSLGHIARPPSGPHRNSQSNVQLDYRTSKHQGAQQHWGVSHIESAQTTRFTEMQLGLSGDRQGDLTAQAGARLDGRYGNFSSTLSHSQFRHAPAQQSLTGSYDSTLVTTGDDFWWSAAGAGTPSGATLISVAGEVAASQDPAVDVAAMGRTITLGLGESTVVTHAGWQESATEIREASQQGNPLFASIAQGAGFKTQFVQPGRLVTREVSANMAYTLVGRALFEGRALAHSVALNGNHARLDDHGGFVLESPTRLKNLYLRDQQHFFACQLNQPVKNGVVHVVGEVDCQPVELTALPQSLQQNSAMARN